MRRGLAVVALVLVAGCASKERALAPPSPVRDGERSTKAEETQRDSTAPQPTPDPDAATPPGDDGRPRQNVLREDPHAKTPHGRGVDPVQDQTPLRVRLPATAVAATSGPLPERLLVALAFVKEGALARDAEAFRDLAHSLESQERVKGVVQTPRPAGSEASARELALAAAKEGVHVVALIVRQTTSRPTGADLFLLEASTGAVIAYRDTRRLEVTPSAQAAVTPLLSRLDERLR